MTKKYIYTCPHCVYTSVLLATERCPCGQMVIKQKGNHIFVKSKDKVKPKIEPCWFSEETAEVMSLEDLLEHRRRYAGEQ